MSQQNATGILDQETAQDVAHTRIYAQPFFEKLASDYGIVPQTAEEQNDLLGMALQLRAKFDEKRVKQAAAGSRFKKLASALGTPAVDEDALAKQAGAILSQDPEVVNAYLSLVAHQMRTTPQPQ